MAFGAPQPDAFFHSGPRNRNFQVTGFARMVNGLSRVFRPTTGLIIGDAAGVPDVTLILRQDCG